MKEDKMILSECFHISIMYIVMHIKTDSKQSLYY